MSQGLFLIQQGLKSLGYDPVYLDGQWGPRTEAAVDAMRAAKGMPADEGDLPWMAEGKRVMGLHETAQKGPLAAFLKSDGATLGDPSKLPWCGDFVATCLRLTLPNEPFPGDLGENPYWARNWALLGRATDPTYGAVLVFSRDGGGHVGFCAGASGANFYVLGGNQSNMVSITPIDKSRLIAARWPMTYQTKPIKLPVMSGGTVSRNEA